MVVVVVVRFDGRDGGDEVMVVNKSAEEVKVGVFKEVVEVAGKVE